MDTKESVLILQHILKCGILEPSISDEVLPIFPSDAASTVAVTLVSCFSQNGSLPAFPTSFSIDWAIQVIAYCLSLPILFNESLLQALTVFRHWVLADSFFPDVSTRNVYFRRIFRYLSLVFEYKNDHSHPVNRKKLICLLLNDIDEYQSKAGQYFEDETWNVLVRVLIGACDFMTLPETFHEYAESNKNPLLVQCFLITYKVLCNSKLTNAVIWDDFLVFCKKWSLIEEFLVAWHQKIAEIWSILLSNLYKEDNSINNEVDEKFLYLKGFQLYKFIRLIDFDNICQKSDLFKVFSKTVVDLVDISTNKSCKSPSLFQPLFPASQFFELFGDWCFKPFENDFCTGHTVLIKSLMTLVPDWDLPVGSPWTTALLSTFYSIIQKNNKQLSLSLLSNGHSLIIKYPYESIVKLFQHVIDNFDSSSNHWITFWTSFAPLLCDIGEMKLIDSNVLETFLEKTSDFRSKLNVLFVLLHHHPVSFAKYVSNLPIKTPNKSSVDDGFLYVDFLTNLCLMIAVAPSFHKMQLDMKPMLIRLLLCFKETRDSKGLMSAFLVMVSQLSKWRDEIYHSSIAVELLDLLSYLYDSELIDKKKILSVSRLLCGRSINRSIVSLNGESPELCEKPIVSFMCGNSSIVSLVGDSKRQDSFLVHVRDPRGLFVWTLSDDLPKNHMFIPQELNDLPPIVKLDINPIKNDYNAPFEELESITTYLTEHEAIDSEYEHSSNHTEKSYIFIHKMQKIDMMKDEEVMKHPLLHYQLRHKIVDFLFQSGIYSNIRKLQEPPETVCKKFDSIPTAHVFNVPVYHLSDQTLDLFGTPLFKRFYSLLGANYCLTESEIPLPSVQLGLLSLTYTPSEQPNESQVCIMFCESPLRLNLKHKSIPKKELIIFVTPLDTMYYLVRSISKNNMFWSVISQERLVSVKYLSEIIASTIFYHIAIKKSEFFYSKDEEREAYLRSVPTTPVSLLKLVESHTLESLSLN